MTQVTLDNITKKFGTETAISEIDLSVNDGEILAVVGPSGCGKSTTLRTIAGFEEPTEGRILFDGENVTDIPPENRNVGLVFQDYALFENMTVLENVTFGPKMQGVPESERIQRAEELLKLVGIEELADRKPSSLSGGQQQRVGLIRALAVEPEIVLLDEPMTGLDAKLKKRLRKEIGYLLRELEVTALYVTHDQTQAMAMADRIVVLNDGQIEQVGEPEELYESPANKFVAEFIGTSNLLTGNVTQNGVDLGFATIEVDISMSYSNQVTLVARPEDFKLGGGPIEGKVVDTYYLGDTFQILLEVDSGEELTLNVNPKHHELSNKSIGDKVNVSLDVSDIHIIDN